MNDMEMLRQQLAEARTQAADWKAKFEQATKEPSFIDMPNEATAQAIASAEANFLATCQDLLKYGRHLENCSGNDKCDCGFFAVYTHAREMTNGEPSETNEIEV